MSSEFTSESNVFKLYIFYLGRLQVQVSALDENINGMYFEQISRQKQ